MSAMSLRDLAFVAVVAVLAITGWTTAIWFDRRCVCCHRHFPDAASRAAHERKAHQI